MRMNIHFKCAAIFALTIAASFSHAASDGSWISTPSGCMVFAPNPVDKNVKVSWSGSCSDGYADGKGILTWSNGNRYEGDVNVGVISGSGTFYWATGDWYEGEFKNGRREGFGTQHYGCSGSYQGEFHRGVMDGIGVLDMADRNRYEGTFRNGVMDGIGIRNAADGSKYEGEFKNNQEEGLGTLLLANRSRYAGEFHANRPEGHALVTDASGSLYEGMYVGGHVDGRGILTKQNGERDVGFFKDPHNTLKLVSTIGPPLYEPCQEHCSTTTPSCGGISLGTINPDDPNYQTKLTSAAVTCGRELNQCVTMCQHQNPTVRELKGIVEIGEVNSTAIMPITSGEPEAKTASNKAAVSFVDEQITASSALRVRLEQQQLQLQTLQQRLASLASARSTAAASTGKPPSDCRSTTRRSGK